MSVGLATRRALQEAAHAGSPSMPSTISDEAIEFANGKASDKLKQDDITFPDRPFMPNFSAMGTPGEVERVRQVRIDLVWMKWFRCAVAVILGLLVLSAYHSFVDARPREIVRGDDIYYGQRAARLATAKSIYVTDPHENCLVGMHKRQEGKVGVSVVSTHC